MQLAAALLMLSGCGHKGPAKHLVTGNVRWNGEPIAKGDIILVPLDPNTRAEATKITNGQFKLRVEPGRKRVQIFAQGEATGKYDPAMQTRLPAWSLPPRYNVNSTLEQDVAPNDDNNWTFDLKP